LDNVEDSDGGDGGEETGNVHAGCAPKMLLGEEDLISLVNDEVGLEGHVQRDEDTEIGKGSDVAQLEGADPFQNSSVFVDHLALLEVETVTGELSGHPHEGLIEIGRMIDILLQFEEAVDGSAEELGMAQTVRYVFVLLFGLDGNVVLVALAVVVVASDWAVQSLLLPFHDVFELGFFVPGSVGDEAILILEGPVDLFGHFPAREAEVGQIWRYRPIGVEVGIDAGNASLVGAIEISDGAPNLTLDSEIMLEVIDDSVVLEYLGFVMVLIEFRFDVVVRVWVLMREGRVGFIVDEDVLFEKLGVGLFLGGVKQTERVVRVGAETGHCGKDPASQHLNE
jgi:hypothetical protein